MSMEAEFSGMDERFTQVVEELAGLRRFPGTAKEFWPRFLGACGQLALADVGFAFAPSIANTGPLPDLPPTLCFRDFRHLSQGIDQLLSDEGREKEALGGILLCIALLDGARASGLEVSREERRLDGLLRKLEQRGLRLS